MHIPLTELLKSIPGAVGIRLEEDLPYTVINRMGDIETRRYQPFTLARTRFTGDYDTASEHCFKTLAEFIFGKNTKQKVTEMTTPVFLDHKGDEWTMSFYLPESVADLSPENAEISIEKMPGKDVAVYTFSGNFDQDAMEDSKRELLKLIQINGLVGTSNVWWAQFDQPMSLPFTKRNEALIQVTLPS